MARELKDVTVRLVSFVRRGANNKKFAIFKSADGTETAVPEEDFSKFMQGAFSEYLAKRGDGSGDGGEAQEDDMTAALEKELGEIRKLVVDLTALTKAGSSGDVLDSVTDETPIGVIAGHVEASIDGLQKDLDGEKVEKVRQSKAEKLAAVRAKLLDALREVPKEQRKAKRTKDDEAKDEEDKKKAVPTQGAGADVSAGAGRAADKDATGDSSTAIDAESLGAENAKAVASALKELKELAVAQAKEIQTLKASPGSSHTPDTDEGGEGVEKSDAYVDPDDTPAGDTGWSADMASGNHKLVKDMGPIVDHGFEIVKKKEKATA